jgi:hypothetical protein
MPAKSGFGFTDAGIVDGDYLGLAKSAKVEDYKPIALTYKANVDRVGHIYTFPIDLVHWSAFLTRMYCSTRAVLGVPVSEFTLKAIADGVVFADMDDERKVQARELMSQFWEAKLPPEGLTLSNHIMGEGAAFIDYSLALASEDDEGGPEYLLGGIQSNYSAMILLAYTAFESLAGDLWMAALNRHTQLARNWCEKNKNQRPEFSDLAGYDFNLSRSMGTFLYEDERVRLQSLGGIVAAYSDAFKGASNAIFEPRGGLREVEQIRHLLAHRGGVVDRKFRDEVEDFPSLNHLAVGSRISFTGSDVSKYVNTTVGCAIRLFKFVDDWSANAQEQV